MANVRATNGGCAPGRPYTIASMIDQDRRWDAVRHRDRTAGFIFGVRTTRIACRPGCPARTPLPENVVFFNDFATAQQAGFRACKRCAPDAVAADAERQSLIARACSLLDADEPVSLEAAARAVGLSRFHFQRVFRQVIGLTPGDYLRSRREQRLRERLASGASVTTAVVAAGYGSPSRVYEARTLGMDPSTFCGGARGERIAYAATTSSLGYLLVARTERGICAIELGDDEPVVVAALRRMYPRADIVADADELEHNLAAVVALIDGNAETAAIVDLDIRGTAFQRRVWNALRSIPRGEVWSYARLAAEIGRPNAVRAVASACGNNRIAVAIPCHRVLGSDGKLRGYRWGVDRKAKLLRRENRDRKPPASG